MEDNRILFTKEMKETHTLLIPTMLPNHFRIIEKIQLPQNLQTVPLGMDDGNILCNCQLINAFFHH